MVKITCIFLFSIATVQTSMKCETQESEAGYTKYLNLYYPKTHMHRYRVNQHLIVLPLYRTSINKILVTELIIMQLSENLNLM